MLTNIEGIDMDLTEDQYLSYLVNKFAKMFGEEITTPQLCQWQGVTKHTLYNYKNRKVDPLPTCERNNYWNVKECLKWFKHNKKGIFKNAGKD